MVTRGYFNESSAGIPCLDLALQLFHSPPSLGNHGVFAAVVEEER